MIKRNPTNAEKAAAAKEKDSKRIRTYFLMFATLLLLVCGFFFAGRQHFSSMDYGMKNSQLRKQIDELEAKKRSLILAREVSLSPAEIKKAAKKSGLLNNTGEIAQVVSSTKEKAAPPQISDVKSMVVKTVSAAPVSTRATLAVQRMDKSPSKMTLSAE